MRFPNVVGERATHGVVFDFINKLNRNNRKLEVLGNGNQDKPYLYVKDLIDAICFFRENSGEKLNYINISVDSTVKVSEIARITADEMGLCPEITYQEEERGWVGDVPKFEYKPDKLRDLGWNAGTTSADAVRKSVRKILEESQSIKGCKIGCSW